MDFNQYRKQFPAVRVFQRYATVQRATRAASHRLTTNQRNAVGEFFYTHVHVPGIGFPTRKAAEQTGYARYQVDQAAPGITIFDASVSPIHLTYTGPLAGSTLCGAPRGDGTAHHAVYAPVESPSYRRQCCRVCLTTFAQAWADAREKPDWVVDVLSTDPAEPTAEQLFLFPSHGDSHAI
ncbi:hypothetical protein [Burkholderia sp. LMG 32019]|uniref:hypothetical protein n=1 Tax=Burkholderia sp. LMG 32019 TaxID=3158173 RepID=UPI003C2DE143